MEKVEWRISLGREVSSGRELMRLGGGQERARGGSTSDRRARKCENAGPRGGGEQWRLP